MGLIIGGWLGYQLAGILGVLMFVPVGAIVGLCAGLMGWRIIYLLAFRRNVPFIDVADPSLLMA